MNEQSNHRTLFVTICSGKGGVGKSVLLSNIAYSLSEKNVKVLVWDADFYYPNQHLIFGVEPPVRLIDVYESRILAHQALFEIKSNLSLLADQPATGQRVELSPRIINDIAKEILDSNDFDIVLIDTPTSTSAEFIQLTLLSDIVLMVVTDEPTSLIDAYGLIKILLQYLDNSKLKLLVNNVIDKEDAHEITTKMNMATEKFLKLNIEQMGYVPYDRLVRKSILNQELVVSSNQDEEISKAIKKIADNLHILANAIIAESKMLV